VEDIWEFLIPIFPEARSTSKSVKLFDFPKMAISSVKIADLQIYWEDSD
jgi:hypothetical protein